MEVIPIPCPHFKITIVKRSQGQSAVAGAAYQSGERLFSEYDQKTKFYNKKKELVHAEIMLPSHAPPGYADRATLWNAVEAVENQWNSQLARRIVLAFPVEVPKEQYLSMIKEFCQEQFVSKGMIADFAIHDKGDGNPHAHILLTLRAMDEHGNWLPKARKVYDLDENGERIQLPSGNWKCHKENTVDWNDQKYAEVWRHSWETITNRYLEAAGRPERVDLRSFERQGGIQQIPTVHLGPAAHQMEKRGIAQMSAALMMLFWVWYPTATALCRTKKHFSSRMTCWVKASLTKLPVPCRAARRSGCWQGFRGNILSLEIR